MRMCTVRFILRLATLTGCCLTSLFPTSGQTPVDGFNPQANDAVRAIALEPSGKVILAGNFTAMNSGATAADRARSRLARVDTNGVVDPAYHPSANGIVLALRGNLDGKLLLGLGFTTSN